MRKPFISSLLVLTILFYFPGAAYGARDKKFSHATPGEAAGEGQFIHGAKPGVLLIRVHILGAVSQQGIHYFPEKVNMLDALLYAGGLSATTKLDGILVRRKGRKELIEIDLEELIEDGGEIPILKDGDVVQIPWNWRRDIATISLITGFLASMTAFTLSIIALTQTK